MEKFMAILEKVSYIVGYILGTSIVIIKRLFVL